MQYIIHNFFYRLPIKTLYKFEFLSPYDFSSKVNKINNTPCNWFHQNHPQYDPHNSYEYKIPKILVIQNYTIPS